MSPQEAGGSEAESQSGTDGSNSLGVVGDTGSSEGSGAGDSGTSGEPETLIEAYTPGSTADPNSIYSQDNGRTEEVLAMEAAIHEHVNAARASYTCYSFDMATKNYSLNYGQMGGQLSYNDELARIARQHSIYLCSNQEFLNMIDNSETAYETVAGMGHGGPNGERVDEKLVKGGVIVVRDNAIISTTLLAPGGTAFYSGENIAVQHSLGAGSLSAGAIADAFINGWLASTHGHKENMLGCRHSLEGIGVAKIDDCIIATEILVGYVG